MTELKNPYAETDPRWTKWEDGARFEMLDHVACANCNFVGAVCQGEDTCPQCSEEGALMTQENTYYFTRTETVQATAYYAVTAETYEDALAEARDGNADDAWTDLIIAHSNGAEGPPQPISEEDHREAALTEIGAAGQHRQHISSIIDHEEPQTPAGLDARELATVLYALRNYQHEEAQELQMATAEEMPEHFHDVAPLDQEEVDDLCDKLNGITSIYEVLGVAHSDTANAFLATIEARSHKEAELAAISERFDMDPAITEVWLNGSRQQGETDWARVVVGGDRGDYENADIQGAGKPNDDGEDLRPYLCFYSLDDPGHTGSVGFIRARSVEYAKAGIRARHPGRTVCFATDGTDARSADQVPAELWSYYAERMPEQYNAATSAEI